MKINGQKINYFNYISSLDNSDCNEALLRIVPKIKLDEINRIIEDVPLISEIRRKFYKKILRMRYEKILEFSYNKLISKS